MKNFASLSNYSRSLWIGLIFLLTLSACSGAPTNTDAALTAREAVVSAESELPKGAAQDPASGVPQAGNPAAGNPAAGVPAAGAPAVADNLGGQPQAGQVQPLAKSPAQAPAAAPLPQSAKPAPAVDLSLPVEGRVGARAPEFTLQTLDGQTVNLAGLLGSPMVISYWSTWCVPCKQELPILQQLSQEYADRGLVVLTVNATDQDDLEKVRAMAGELGMTFPVLLDEAKDFASQYNAMFFPSTFFIDANGVIREIKLGDSTEADLRTRIENLLAAQ